MSMYLTQVKVSGLDPGQRGRGFSMRSSVTEIGYAGSNPAPKAHNHEQVDKARTIVARLKVLVELVEEGLTDALIAERFGWTTRTVASYRLFLQLYKRGEGRRAGPRLRGRGHGRWREARP